MIKEHRQAAGLTQKELSEKTGIPLDTIKAWDCGRRKPPAWVEKLIIKKLKEEQNQPKKEPSGS